jgi:tetratricopeptide (TPR) repeat protein
MISISACVIVRDEEKNIGQWLQCVQQIADELVVVDTGSTDRTVFIAEQGGARVYHFAWCNDFAAAKNFALEHARGEWIIFLDADEYFPGRVIPRLREHIKMYHPNRRIVGIICRLLNIDKDDKDRFIGSIGQIRVFRNMKALRYTGVVHEHLMNTSRNGRCLKVAEDLEIYHTGYSQKIIRAKLQRNLALLQDKIASQGEQPEDFLYLADCYFGLGDYARAIQHAKKAIDSGVDFVGMRGQAENTLIVSMIQLKYPSEEILQAIDTAAAANPTAPEYPMRKGLLYWDMQDYLKAEPFFKQGIALSGQAKEAPSACLENNGRQLLPHVYMYLGKLEKMKLNMQQAVNYFLQGLEVYPYEPTLFSCFYQCIAQEPPADIIEVLNNMYDKNEDAAFLAEVLRKNHSGQVYLYYVRRTAGYQGDSLPDYVEAGRYDAAAVKAADELDSLYRLGIWSAQKQDMEPEQAVLTLILPDTYKKAWQSFRKNETEDATPLARTLYNMKTSLARWHSSILKMGASADETTK